MGIFREYDSGGRDRSAEDRRRHRELVEESIKRNIGDIISEESIIGQSRNKKIKIPIKSIKEYRFVYGKNSPGVTRGDGDERRGDIIGEDAGHGSGKGQGAGNQEGEDIYETEVTIEELLNYLLEDLELPNIDKRKLSDVERITYSKNLGYKRKGITSRLAKKRSVIEKIKRKQAYKRDLAEREEMERNSGQDINSEMDSISDDKACQEAKKVDKARESINIGSAHARSASVKRKMTPDGRFPFMEDDLRYHRVREDRKKDFNAAIICIMDVSGSMDQTKKYMARSFYFLLYQFISMKYANVEVVFVAHTTTAKEVSEKEFFHKGESGGTYISSGYEKALEIIEQRYNPQNWNIYAFHCSDGDNWTEDNNKAVELAGELCKVCNLFGYGEIVPGYYSSGSTIKTEYQKNLHYDNFVVVTLIKKEDVLEGLKRLLSNSAGGLSNV